MKQYPYEREICTPSPTHEDSHDAAVERAMSIMHIEDEALRKQFEELIETTDYDELNALDHDEIQEKYDGMVSDNPIDAK